MEEHVYLHYQGAEKKLTTYRVDMTKSCILTLITQELSVKPRLSGLSIRKLSIIIQHVKLFYLFVTLFGRVSHTITQLKIRSIKLYSVNY